MDSLSQLALGAAWKAALWGGAAGTLPDLDVVVDHGDAILNMVLHRAESHSLLFLALLAGPLGWAIARLHGEPVLARHWGAAMDGDRYHEGFYALLDQGRPMRFTSHPQGQALVQAHAAHPQVQRVARFSSGFFRLCQTGDGTLWLTDLRMGQEPNYVFRFNIGLPLGGGDAPPQATQEGMRIDASAALTWLWQRALGNDVPPPGQPPTPTTQTPP
jgi:hypothetical protein